MLSSLRLMPLMLVLVTLWGAAMMAALQLPQHLLHGHEHSVCGPWGCGPPTSALLACHGFWLASLSLPIGLACVYLQPGRLKWVGLTGVVMAIAGLGGVAVWEAIFWLPVAGELYQNYFFQRWMFSVATSVDLPIVEIGLFGLACLAVGTVRGSEARTICCQPTLENLPS